MAEILDLQKRPGEDEEQGEDDGAENTKFDNSSSNSKRHKPYSNILSLLEEEREDKEESSQDLSTMFIALQRELSFSSTSTSTSTSDLEETSHHQSTGDGENSAVRRLLDPSDDEIGIPDAAEEINPVENLPSDFWDEQVWETEHFFANYYDDTELFLQSFG